MSNTKTIYALGFFDGVHRGHQVLMTACRELAQQLDCRAGAITFLTHPEEVIRGERVCLLSSVEDRDTLLVEVGKMDTVIMLPFDDAMRQMPCEAFFRMMCQCHNAAGFVCGTDYRFGHMGKGTPEVLQALCKQAGIPCRVMEKLCDDTGEISSGRIRDLLKAGKLAQANRLLGHPHMLTGTVVSGHQLGRRLGTPTANLVLPEGLDCLRHGVYACKARVEGQEYLAVTNVGTRPTVGGSHTTVESWLLDFTGDLYGKPIRLDFYAFLREEKKFPTIEDLRTEIQKNAGQTRDFFEKI